ncbi:hypothetical protein KVV02_004314 [Mortierella alpina]|uniref:Uncharacterized protein n=1 Tax=Mortierella alpina TaxID=64518 RepID=A0A9P8A250_MORAP|nr:hypothetical protein KVV02_004314 [Mortierella alpina]
MSLDGWCQVCCTHHVPRQFRRGSHFQHLSQCPKTAPQVMQLLFLVTLGSALAAASKDTHEEEAANFGNSIGRTPYCHHRRIPEQQGVPVLHQAVILKKSQENSKGPDEGHQAARGPGVLQRQVRFIQETLLESAKGYERSGGHRDSGDCTGPGQKAD